MDFISIMYGHFFLFSVIHRCVTTSEFLTAVQLVLKYQFNPSSMNAAVLSNVLFSKLYIYIQFVNSLRKILFTVFA